jgi:hypothetical protein
MPRTLAVVFITLSAIAAGRAASQPQNPTPLFFENKSITVNRAVMDIRVAYMSDGTVRWERR